MVTSTQRLPDAKTVKNRVHVDVVVVADDPVMSALRGYLDGRWANVRAKARQFLCQRELAPFAGTDVDTHRIRVNEQLRLLADSGLPGLGFPTACGGGGDVGGAGVGFEVLAMGDLLRMVKAGVQFGLFGGAILQLGTDRRHERYLLDVISLGLPGCFAMTETVHGSDLASLRTTATYDAAAQQFVISTPDDSARKDYIGNAARDGRMAVVFAQLVTNGEPRGVHAFLVPIRSSSGETAHGVRIDDCG